MPLPMYIHVKPDPPVHGTDLEISYDQEGTEADEITLDIEWLPEGLEPRNVKITFPPGKKTITIPPEARQIEITDPTGASMGLGRSILSNPDDG